VSKLNTSQKEQLKRCIIDSNVRRLTILETKKYIHERMNGIDISTHYIKHLKADLKNDTKKKFESLRKDRDIYLEEIFFKRVAELEDSQITLQNIIDNSEDDEIRIKAISELTNISILISNYYSQLPSMNSLGVDAFIPSNNNNNITTTEAGEEEKKDFASRPEYSV
jgi:hypothetical protein